MAMGSNYLARTSSSYHMYLPSIPNRLTASLFPTLLPIVNWSSGTRDCSTTDFSESGARWVGYPPFASTAAVAADVLAAQLCAVLGGGLQREQNISFHQASDLRTSRWTLCWGEGGGQGR